VVSVFNLVVLVLVLLCGIFPCFILSVCITAYIGYVCYMLIKYRSIYTARQLYKNVSMLFLFPVKDGKLSTGVNATFDASCYGRLKSSTI